MLDFIFAQPIVVIMSINSEMKIPIFAMITRDKITPNLNQFYNLLMIGHF